MCRPKWATVWMATPSCRTALTKASAARSRATVDRDRPAAEDRARFAVVGVAAPEGVQVDDHDEIGPGRVPLALAGDHAGQGVGGVGVAPLERPPGGSAPGAGRGRSRRRAGSRTGCRPPAAARRCRPRCRSRCASGARGGPRGAGGAAAGHPSPPDAGRGPGSATSGARPWRPPPGAQLRSRAGPARSARSRRPARATRTPPAAPPWSARTTRPASPSPTRRGRRRPRSRPPGPASPRRRRTRRCGGRRRTPPGPRPAPWPPRTPSPREASSVTTVAQSAPASDRRVERGEEAAQLAGPFDEHGDRHAAPPPRHARS